MRRRVGGRCRGGSVGQDGQRRSFTTAGATTAMLTLPQTHHTTLAEGGHGSVDPCPLLTR